MLRSMKDLENCKLRAIDGTIGHVQDFYFEDTTWIVRYLVVDTGNWLSRRKVLISPIALGPPDWAEKVLPVSITKLQIENSPNIDTDKPVSRQHEQQYLDYYGYPFYWGGSGLWGAGAFPTAMLGIGSGGLSVNDALRLDDAIRTEAERSPSTKGDPHLRSCKALMTYRIEATDGGVGHVQGLLVDAATWAIRYLVVETSNWWLGHQVLIAPKWIRDINWVDTTVSVALTQQAVKDAPPYDSSTPPNRAEETVLYKHHGHTGYWADEVNLENPQYRATATASAPSGRAANRP